jgi:hypothetical protein
VKEFAKRVWSFPAAGQALPDGLFTRRVPLKGFRFTSHSPFPSLAWRNGIDPRAQGSRRPRCIEAPDLRRWREVLHEYHLLYAKTIMRRCVRSAPADISEAHKRKMLTRFEVLAR